MTNIDPKKYWESLEALADDPKVQAARGREFPDELPVGQAAVPVDQVPRRDFFKMMGLSATAAMMACHRAPVEKIIPYVSKPDELIPGVALWYASSCSGCSAGCGILVKSRDGRPIKIEGNADHPLSRGGVCAVGQATVLSLYDADAASGPLSRGKPNPWSSQDDEVRAALQKLTGQKKGVRLVLPWIIGPTAEAAVQRFVAAYPTTVVVRYDPLGELDALAEAHRLAYGRRALPQYRFDQARVIASFGADFLGTWISPVVFTKQYADAHHPSRGAAMVRHYQLESVMSTTGANADRRLPIAPSDQLPLLAELVRRLSRRNPAAVPAALGSALAGLPPPSEPVALEALEQDLWAARGQALVVCGSGSPQAQLLTVLANELLGNVGKTVSVAAGTPLDERAQTFDAFLADLESGAVGGVVLHGVNPVYSHPQGEALAARLEKLELSVSTADRLDETAAHVQHLAPDHNGLESWGDAESAAGLLTLRQPVVSPLRDSRSAVESISSWAGGSQTHYQLLQDRWQKEVYPSAGSAASFQTFWDDAVREGFVQLKVPAAAEPRLETASLAGALGGAPAPAPGADALELALYSKISMRDGALANNGWLQELPDPITKITWTNTVQVGPARAKELGLSDGDLVRLTAGGQSVEAPVVIQPGLHPRAVGLAVGYGRTRAGRLGNGLGVNAWRLIAGSAVSRRLPPRVALTKLGGTATLARTQIYSSEAGRPIIREADLTEFIRDPHAGNEEAAEEPISLWSGHAYPGHRWGMAVDLSRCTGCSACVIACEAENNIPVVGADEVARAREMHWIRIDRYYEGPAESPRVVHQPMLCQHCENAPCETVCPVLATVHSSEGLNQQIYNRCVGTRYCANNCPAKVRRFNWFSYHHDDNLARMVLNPDVVVRSRGVMEKCSMCVQRIQDGKAAATRAGVPLKDGDIKTACQQSCPADAIVFGDLNDPKSKVATLIHGPRGYRLFGDLNVRPSISYLTKIRNAGNDEGSHG